MDFAQLKECITALPPNQDPTRILSLRNSENWNRPVLVLVNALEDHVFFYKKVTVPHICHQMLTTFLHLPLLTRVSKVANAR